LPQQGGQAPVPAVIPTVIQTRTSPGTPFISNVAKEVHAAKMAEAQTTGQATQGTQNGPSSPTKSRARRTKESAGIPITQSTWVENPSTMQPSLKLEVFNPDPKQQRPYGVYNPLMPVVELAPNKKFMPGIYQNLFAPTSAISCGPNVQMPVQNVYPIILPGPTGDHVRMNQIYEDILPGKDGKMTSTTLGERLQTYDYVRQILVRIDEGEDISLDSNGQNTLLSYIKFMELNPNFYSPISNNPYKGLPFGLLIYRSCFPIRLNEPSQMVVCAPNSIGLNIRLYALSYAEYYSYKYRQKEIWPQYDVWRELVYYQYIRENIVKKKQSPNFPILYAFFFCPNKNIDFFSLKKNCLTQKDMLTREFQRFLEFNNLLSKVKPDVIIDRPLSLLSYVATVPKLPDEVDPSLQRYSGNTLILITEAPTHNLYQWASRIYEQDGIRKKMISHGYHGEPVWLGILFQIVSALYVMQLHGIYIRKMTIQDNIYIKDLPTHGKAMGYWKYIINGISYYVPNYGYLVMIDSNYKDIVPVVPGSPYQCERQYKIYTHNIIGRRYNLADIQRKIYENYKAIINTNAFSKEHTLNNVNRPPEAIMKLIDSMMEDNEQDLGKVIAKYFRPLMNNRIGTLLRKDTEIPNIREITGTFKNGELAIEVLEENLYRWCLVLNQRNDGIVEIISRDMSKPNDFIHREVRVETLKQYNPSEKIEQNTDPDVNLSEQELLETYIVSL